MALQADYIDTSLNTFLKALITQYSRIGWAMDTAVSIAFFAIYCISYGLYLISADMLALTTPAGTRLDSRQASLMRPSLATTTPTSTLPQTPLVSLDSPGRILSSLLRSESHSYTSWPSNNVF